MKQVVHNQFLSRLLLAFTLVLSLWGCRKDDRGFDLIYEQAVVPTARFEVVEIENCQPPYRVTFTNLTTDTLGNETWLWDYGNGTTSVFEQAAVMSYATAGKYTVNLVASNAVGHDTFSLVLDLPDTLPVISAFSWEPAAFNLRAPAPVQFNNLSEHASSYTWQFGDGQSSTDKNPVHWYDQAGNYTATLISECGNQEEVSFAAVEIKPPPSRFVVREIELLFIPERYYNDPDNADGTVGLDIYFEAFLGGNFVLSGSTLNGVLGPDLPIGWLTSDPLAISTFSQNFQLRFFDDDFNGLPQSIANMNISLQQLQDANYPDVWVQADLDDLEVRLRLEWLN
ncbi:MAG: PKD domain-containing protein [Salibacteraceae bacterium]